MHEPCCIRTLILIKRDINGLACVDAAIYDDCLRVVWSHVMVEISLSILING